MGDNSVQLYDQPAVVDVYMPAATVKQAMERRDIIKNFVSLAMKRDHDYGIVPGTQKPTLLKPGAEKLCNLFGLSPGFTSTKEVEDWTGEGHGGEMFFHYAYKCILTRNGVVVGEGEGSCNSWEKKYRYRKGGGGEHIPNPDIADQINTLSKMAQKRALIAATLIACSASEFFTQDKEDGSESTPRPMPQRKAGGISEGQWKRLWAIASGRGMDAAGIADWLKDNGHDAAQKGGDMTVAKYEEIIKALEVGK